MEAQADQGAREAGEDVVAPEGLVRPTDGAGAAAPMGTMA
jgi:hypothetical protein